MTSPFSLVAFLASRRCILVLPDVRKSGWLLGAAAGHQRPVHGSSSTAASEAAAEKGSLGGTNSHDISLGVPPAEHPAALLRQLLDRLPPYPTHTTLQHARRWMEDAGWGADTPTHPLTAGGRASAAAIPFSARDADANAILAIVTGLLQRATRQPTDLHWARASLPELLLLLSRLRLPSHPKLESALILILRRGKLPPAPDTNAGQQLQRGSVAAVPPPAASPSPPPALPTALRLTQAMSSLPVRSHEAWQQLAERQLLKPPGRLLEALSADQAALLAAAFARAGYHPVPLFRSLADRMMDAVPYMQAGSLARALHAFAVLRHHDPLFTAALCLEVYNRMQAGSVGGGGTAGGRGAVDAASGGGGSSLLSLAGAALFGGSRGGRPDRAHRAPQFLLEDLTRLAAAAVQLGAAEGAVRAYGSGGDGGGVSVAHAGGLGEGLLAAVAEEAEAAVAMRMRLVREAAKAQRQSLPPMEAGPVWAGGDGAIYVEGYDGLYSTDAPDRQSTELDSDGSGTWPEPPRDSGSSISNSSSSNLPADQLEPVMALLEALVAGGGGSSGTAGPGAAAANAAHAIAARHLVPELAALEQYLAPGQLLTLMAALLPPRAAAALLRSGASHPYPFKGPLPPPPPPQPARLSVLSYVMDSSPSPAAHTAAATTPGDQLAAVVAALCRRTDPRVFRGAQPLLDAWHLLAAARAVGGSGSDDPRVVRQLMGPVCASVVRHATMLDSAPVAASFVVSCALLSVYDKQALDAVAGKLVAALGGGGGGRQLPQQRAVAVAADDRGHACGLRGAFSGGLRAHGLAPAALAQLAWAVGQLGYGNEELLAAIQRQALALSAPAAVEPQNYAYDYQQKQSQPQPQYAAGGGRGGADLSAARPHPQSPRPHAPPQPPLGPLELADVMWCLAVNQFRSALGADMREMYLRAASQGVVHIDDPRWLRLVQVHVLLLLGWAGGLGEAAAGRLRSGWFNALSYAWEHQAVARGEQLAGPTGQPPDPDPATAAFRQSVAAAARKLLRTGVPAVESSSSGGGAGGGDGAGSYRCGGRWRLHESYVLGMLQPSPDIRLTVPLLVRRPAEPLAPTIAAAGGFAGPLGGFRAGLAASGFGGGGRDDGGEWLVALDLVRHADEAAVVGMEPGCATPPTLPTYAVPEQGAAAAVAAATVSTTCDLGSQAREQGAGGGVVHLLGPARWRQLVLRRLGVLAAPVRQEEWERADGGARRDMLLRAMRLQ